MQISSCFKRAFQNKRVLVTGGASGLGKEMALILQAAGALVWVIDRDKNGLQKLKESISEKLQVREGDLLNDSFRSQIFSELNSSGGLDILINNAGTVAGGSIFEVNDELHKRTIDVNLTAVILWTKTLLPLLLQKQKSHLINVSSASAFLAFANASSYSASKWGVLGFSESLDLEINAGEKHLQITVACPSYIQTPLFEGAKAPLFTKFLNPKTLAERILKSAIKNKFVVADPWLVRAVPLVKAILPYWLWKRLLISLGVHRGMLSWHGRS